jgi:hypothetical protein
MAYFKPLWYASIVLIPHLLYPRTRHSSSSPWCSFFDISAAAPAMGEGLQDWLCSMFGVQQWLLVLGASGSFAKIGRITAIGMPWGADYSFVIRHLICFC